MTDPFFSEKNEAMLQRVLYNDVCRRLGGAELSEKQASRLMKTVKHYMGEVHRHRGGQLPVAAMNKEVLQVTLPDYLQYLQRQQRSSSRSVVSDIEEGPGEQAPAPGSIRMLEDTIPSSGSRQVHRSQMDITNAFAQLQAQRQEGRPRPPAPQDFRLSLQDEPPVSLDTFDRIRKEREQEATRVSEYQQQLLQKQQQGQIAYGDATDNFARDRRRMEEEAEAALAERERKSLEARAAASGSALPLAPPPDMRSLFMGDRQQIGRTNQSSFQPVVPPNSSAGNPTLALPGSQVPRETSGQQVIITREPDTMTYKETELNLFVYSADRDWVSNSQETRYNFTVTFDPANLPTGLRLNPTSTVKFRNISRIELVKAIMPGESIDSLVTRTYSGGTFTYSAPYNINVLSFPYVQLRIPELDNNVYGTNQSLNAAFGVLQYDANWIYDTTNANQRGYFAMIPKFLKCQKVYQPTPLSTLTKLSFRFERPDGQLISTVPDTLDILQIYGSKEVNPSTGFPYGYDAAVENGTGSAYYFIKTTTYFNLLTVTKGDRINIKNLVWSGTPSSSQQASLTELTPFLQTDSGLLVVDVGYGTNPAAGITIGANKQGYCNFIIVRGKFSDPTLGGTTTTTLGGQADSSAGFGTVTVGSLTDFLSTNALTSGRLLNASHQVQVSLRVIVREMDSMGFLRPDNL